MSLGKKFLPSSIDVKMDLCLLQGGVGVVRSLMLNRLFSVNQELLETTETSSLCLVSFKSVNV